METVGSLPAAAAGAASAPSEQAVAKAKATDNVDEQGAGDGCTDGEGAEKGMREGKDGEEDQEGEQPRLFESLISVSWGGVEFMLSAKPPRDNRTETVVAGMKLNPAIVVVSPLTCWLYRV